LLHKSIWLVHKYSWLLAGSEFLYGGRLWDISHVDYKELAKESEYASWLAAHGYGANHLTVSVNQLNALYEVKGVNDHLRNSGFTINEFGGEVKGSPDVLLEQSSTMVDKVSVTFIEGTEVVPGGFYEFAKRYPMANGELYPGFVAASSVSVGAFLLSSKLSILDLQILLALSGVFLYYFPSLILGQFSLVPCFLWTTEPFVEAE
jgi:hypothetical protein